MQSGYLSIQEQGSGLRSTTSCASALSLLRGDKAGSREPTKALSDSPAAVRPAIRHRLLASSHKILPSSGLPQGWRACKPEVVWSNDNCLS